MSAVVLMSFHFYREPQRQCYKDCYQVRYKTRLAKPAS